MDAKIQERATWSAAIALAFGVGWFSRTGTDVPEPIKVEPVIGAVQAGPVQEGSDVTVHVVGLVKKPGVYTLGAGSRVRDAIARAGGPGAHADMDTLNLAQILEDGVQVRVTKQGAAPVEAAVPDAFGAVSVPGSSTGSSSKSAKPAARSISLNSASPAELDRLPGVGPSTAAKIIEYRRAHGGFASIDELMSVKGIGPKKLKEMRPYVRL